jgi:hypothetical protein
MDITITEIDKEFNIIKDIKEQLLNNSDLNEKSNKKVNLEINTNTTIKIDLVKIVYIKLFKEPIDGIYDINKLKVIEKHLKHNNLI